MKISIVVAVSLNNSIGKNNQLPWHLPLDLKFFKKTTQGGTVIMGRKTFESIGKPLPNRRNIVISSQKKNIAGVEVTNSLEAAIALSKDNNPNEIFIIGGGQIYEQALPIANRIYLTKVNTFIDGEVFFPMLKHSDWDYNLIMAHSKDEKHKYDFEIWMLDKKATSDK
jgi:dihydrofolate reductase